MQIYKLVFKNDKEHIGNTPFYLAMPDDCKSEDPVESYRKYYLNYKAYFAKWFDKTPYWFKSDLSL